MSEESNSYRFATSADVTAIVALVESAYRGQGSRAGWTTEADLLDGQRTDEEEVSALLSDEKTRIILATRGALLVGCVLARLEEGQGYIGMLAVRPTEQGSRIGRRLLEEAEHTLRRKFGATVARMTVLRQRSELIAWYERRGYQHTGKSEPFPYGNPRFGLPRRPDLEFVVLSRAIA